MIEDMTKTYKEGLQDGARLMREAAALVCEAGADTARAHGNGAEVHEPFLRYAAQKIRELPTNASAYDHA